DHTKRLPQTGNSGWDPVARVKSRDRDRRKCAQWGSLIGWTSVVSSPVSSAAGREQTREEDGL
ncbi:MAG: hypothetical protein P8Y93_09640, partial [Acidobacteriota bacterium]